MNETPAASETIAIVESSYDRILAWKAAGDPDADEVTYEIEAAFYNADGQLLGKSNYETQNNFLLLKQEQTEFEGRVLRGEIQALEAGAVTFGIGLVIKGAVAFACPPCALAAVVVTAGTYVVYNVVTSDSKEKSHPKIYKDPEPFKSPVPAPTHPEIPKDPEGPNEPGSDPGTDPTTPDPTTPGNPTQPADPGTGTNPGTGTDTGTGGGATPKDPETKPGTETTPGTGTIPGTGTPDKEEDKDDVWTTLASEKSNSDWADFDADGDFDLAIMTLDKSQPLKRGQKYFPRTFKLYMNVLNLHNYALAPYPLQFPALPEIAEGSITWFNANNDGYLDLFITGRDTLGNAYSKIYYQSSSSEIHKMVANVAEFVTGEQLIKENEDPKVKIPYFYDPSAIQNPVIHSILNMPKLDIPGLYNSASAAGDLNNDGLQDLVVSGLTRDGKPFAGIYYQQKDGSGFKKQSTALDPVVNGSISLADYDRSGRLSILMTGDQKAKLYHQEENGTFKEASLPVTTGGHSKWWDFNSDGYMDIIIAGKPSVILENNKKGTFTNVTSSLVTAGFPGLANSAIEVADINNDGKSDFIVSGTADMQNYLTQIYLHDGGDKTSFSIDNSHRLPQVHSGSINFLFDGKGDNQVFLTGTEAPVSEVVAKAAKEKITLKDEPLTRLLVPSLDLYELTNESDEDKQNQLPVSPIGMVATVNKDNSVTLSWRESYDKETEYRGLTYNVYISSTPGDDLITPGHFVQNPDGSYSYSDQPNKSWLKTRFSDNSGDVLRPLSLIPFGSRVVLQAGNTSRNSYTIKGLEPGKVYYWSVQTIDNSYRASNFSKERSFYVGPAQNIDPGNQSVSVHPAVSPNNDGINDKLTINGIEKYSTNRVQIFNSAGKDVWSANNYDNTKTVFPYRNGVQEEFPEGTYYYVINYDYNKWITGFLILLK